MTVNRARILAVGDRLADTRVGHLRGVVTCKRYFSVTVRWRTGRSERIFSGDALTWEGIDVIP